MVGDLAELYEDMGLGFKDFRKVLSGGFCDLSFQMN
jgi:hypothetical protein